MDVDWDLPIDPNALPLEEFIMEQVPQEEEVAGGEQLLVGDQQLGGGEEGEVMVLGNAAQQQYIAPGAVFGSNINHSPPPPALTDITATPYAHPHVEVTNQHVAPDQPRLQAQGKAKNPLGVASDSLTAKKKELKTDAYNARARAMRNEKREKGVCTVKSCKLPAAAPQKRCEGHIVSLRLAKRGYRAKPSA